MLYRIALAILPLLQGALAAPEPVPHPETLAEHDGLIGPRQGGYFWSYWSEGTGNFNCNNGAGGSYTVNWSGNGGFVCGKGWNPGGPRYVLPFRTNLSRLRHFNPLGTSEIKYSGTYDPTGPGYLAIYGWTQNPLIEYYIIDAHGELAPNEPWTAKGNFTFEEGTYEVFESTRVQKPSIEGTRTFQQYWSVRTEQRVGGTVSTGRHFEEWQKLGMGLGYHNYMILAVEGYTNQATGTTSSGTASLNLE